MKLKITKELLKAHRACNQGYNEFVELYPEGLELDWSLETQIEVLKGPLRKYFGWGYYVGLIPIFTFKDANLSGANLIDANLSGANLSGAIVVKN